MPSEVAQRYDRKLFDLRGENSGLPLQAFEVAWTGKRKDHSVLIGILLGVSLSVVAVLITGALLS